MLCYVTWIYVCSFSPIHLCCIFKVYHLSGCQWSIVNFNSMGCLRQIPRCHLRLNHLRIISETIPRNVSHLTSVYFLLLLSFGPFLPNQIQCLSWCHRSGMEPGSRACFKYQEPHSGPQACLVSAGYLPGLHNFPPWLCVATILAVIYRVTWFLL